MGLWKSKNPAPSRKRSILKSPKGKPAKVAFHIDKTRPKSHPSTPKQKSSGTKKCVKTDANTGPSQVCFKDDVVEGDDTPVNENRKSNKSVLCRSSAELHEHGNKSRRQSKTRTEESADRPKIFHGRKGHQEDKTHSIYVWLEQSEKAMKKCSSTSKQSLERDLAPTPSPTKAKKLKSRSHVHSSTGEDEGSNKAQISDTNRHDSPEPTATKRVSSHRHSKERYEQKAKFPRVAQTKRESIDMDKVIKQRIFNALDKRELRLAAKKHLIKKKTASTVERVNNIPEESRRTTRYRARPIKSKHTGNYDRSRRQLEPEKRLARRSRRDLKSKQGHSSSSDSPVKLQRSRSRRSRKKLKRTRSKKIRKSKIRSKSNNANRNESEAKFSDGEARTIKFAKTPKKSKLSPEPEKDADIPAAAVEENQLGQSSDDVPEAPSLTDLRQVPVFAYAAELCTIPIIDEKQHKPENTILNPQGDWLPNTRTSLSRPWGNNAEIPNQNPQNRGDDLTRVNIDFSLIKCSPRKQIRQKTFLPGVPNYRLNTQQSSIRNENVCLHRTKNDTDLTDGTQNLRRSKPCISLVENSKPIATKLEQFQSSPSVDEVERKQQQIQQQTIQQTSSESAEAEANVRAAPAPQGDHNLLGNKDGDKSVSSENRSIECNVGDAMGDKICEDQQQLKHDKKPKRAQTPIDAILNDGNVKKIEDDKKPLKMQPLLPQSCRSPKGPKNKDSIEVLKENQKCQRKSKQKEKNTSCQKRKLPREQRPPKARGQNKLLQECVKYRGVPEGYAKETRIPAKPRKKHGKNQPVLSDNKPRNSNKKKDHHRKPTKKDAPSDGKRISVRNRSLEKVKKSANSGSQNKDPPSDPKPRDSKRSGKPSYSGYTGTGTGTYGDYSDEYGDYSGSYSGDSYDSYDSDRGSDDVVFSDESSDAISESPSSPDDNTGSNAEEAKDNVPECTATENGGICFKLPGRVTHKTTIKVAHFPRSDPICINIPPPPNPCCCPPNPWCCPNPYCPPPNPCCNQDPCNRNPCCCCTPGANGGGGGGGGLPGAGGGKVLNNCNIYSGASEVVTQRRRS